MIIYLIIPLLGIILALINYVIIIKKDEGTDKMKEISNAIKSGADTFIFHEYSVVFKIAIPISILLGFITAWYVAISFLIGALMSSLAGYIGMKIATRANVRVTNTARVTRNIDKTLKLAFFGGSVMGLSVGSFALFGLGLVFLIFNYQLDREYLKIVKNYLGINFIPFAMTVSGYSLGCSIIALFDRVGGGVYTKAADMAADLVGKTELKLPEDDPRNPATIADNVGDNVGDVAGLGADLLESYVGSILSAIILASYIYVLSDSIDYEIAKKLIFYPFIYMLIGLVSSMLGIYYVVFKKGVGKPHTTLNAALFISAFLSMIGNFFMTKFYLNDIEGLSNFGFRFGKYSPFFSSILGVFVGIIIGLLAEYYTSDNFKPTKELSLKSLQGSAIVISSGMALGMKSVFLPSIFLFISIILANFFSGLYGVAMASVGMLSFVATSVSVDSYGPIADNAGGISEMAQLDPEVRKITDELDMVGNTTAAIGKGFAIGSAALAALSLFASYVFSQTSPGMVMKNIFDFLNLNIINAKTLSGAIVGAALPYMFSGILIDSVVETAAVMVDEIRRQVNENPGILDGTVKPDYKKCIKISASGAIKQMSIPVFIAVLTPIISGFIFGTQFIGGLLVGTTLSGIMLALFTANSGGAWDNAKKHLEQGKIKGLGKGSDEHKALVVGDTVGDPLKDTVGPSLDILIKIMAVISLILAPLFFKFHLF